MPADRPSAGHNKPHAETLLAEVRHSLHAHSRHSKEAKQELHKFLAAVMRTCEYARGNEDTRQEVELALFRAGINRPPKEREWLRAIICAAHAKEAREVEKTNISKWASALCYAERRGVGADGLAEWLKDKSIAQLARKEAQERRKEKPPRKAKADGSGELLKQQEAPGAARPAAIPVPCDLPGDKFADGMTGTLRRTEDGWQFVPAEPEPATA